jgi:hypothetical protein
MADVVDPSTRAARTFRGQRLSSVDRFFAWRGPRFERSILGWSPLEHELQAAWRWWHPDDRERTNEAVLPAGVAAVARTIASNVNDGMLIEVP